MVILESSTSALEHEARRKLLGTLVGHYVVSDQHGILLTINSQTTPITLGAVSVSCLSEITGRQFIREAVIRDNSKTTDSNSFCSTDTGRISQSGGALLDGLKSNTTKEQTSAGRSVLGPGAISVISDSYLLGHIIGR